MTYIKTPNGDVFALDDCEILENYQADNDQAVLAASLFEQDNILIADCGGGEG